MQYIRQREAILDGSGEKFAIKQEDIVKQVHASVKRDIEDLNSETLIANAVISSIIIKEKILRIVEDSRDHNTRMLALHPDFLEENL